jgi:tRNA A-37 threonylcarbamoyl transferase component Bud32
MRVLLIADDPTYTRLLRQHVLTAFDAAEISTIAPSREGPLPGEYTAAAYDVVLLDCAPGGNDGLAWIRDGVARPLFPPIVYLQAGSTAEESQAALDAGAFGVLSRAKIDHARLAALLRDARELRRQAREQFRLTPAAAGMNKFGEIIIKGERCIRLLATSAISAVYLAESERVGRLVVLKVFSQVPDLAEKASAFDRFLQEYEIIRRIDHPNVVKIHDLGIADDHAYIAMEYFPAGDLRARIKRHLRAEDAAAILKQMAGALAAIHAEGVLHRDLKPGNVMLRVDGSIALIDFGLAKQLELEAEITATGEIFGTPYYMSPEQGHGREVDVRSDLYSLGVIFYEMLIGKKPFLAPTPMAVIYKHSHAPLPELPPAIAAWHSIVAKLLAKAPGDRYQSAREVVSALERVSDSWTDGSDAAPGAPT